MSALFALGMMPTVPAVAEEASAESGASVQSIAPESTTLEDGTYSMTANSSMGMATLMDGDYSSYAVVSGDNAYLVLNITTSPDTNGAVKYDAMYIGKRSEAPDDASTADVIEGIPIRYGDSTTESYAFDGSTFKYNDGSGVVFGYTYVVPVTKDELITLLDDGADQDIYFVMRYTSHYESSSGTSNAGKWSGSKDNYFTFSDLTKTSDSTEVPSSSTDIELTVTNNTGMFKVTKAVITDDGSTFRVTLSSSGYHYLFVGTYEEAVANGVDTSNWVVGQQDSDGAWYFDIPITSDTSYIPVVTISQRYYEGYLAGDNTLARAFYPRQLTLDQSALTLVTGDYDYTQDLTVTNSTGIATSDVATLETLGGPNSNSYSETLDLTMSDSTYDKAFIGSSTDAASATNTVAISDSKFSLELSADQIESPFTLAFHNSTSDSWVDCVATVSKTDSTLTLSESQIEAVKAMIRKLPDAMEVTNADAARINATQAAYEGLSEDEQTTLDSLTAQKEDKSYAYDSDQPYGRVLEVAVWGLDALQTVDNSTILNRGVYDSSNSDLTSTYSKGKSTSRRNKVWSIESVNVDNDGNATAILTVESSTYTKVFVNGQVYENQSASGENSTFEIPIDLNSTMHFNALTTAMSAEHWVAFEITNQITETAEANWMRISGKDRYLTMGAIVEEGFDSSEYAVVASGENFPDALAASSLAGVHNTPVILTNSDELSTSASDELESLGVTNVLIVGGTAAVSSDVESSIEGMGIEVTRLSGKTRQDTAVDIMDAVIDASSTDPDTVIIACGKNFPDSLSIAPYSYVKGAPILLAENDGTLSDGTLSAITKSGATKAIIVGGNGAVASSVEGQLESAGISSGNISRLGGKTRYDTSALIVSMELENG
ncbi:MAG: cell wall-binding repeat-containing protein, partial [Coriobacteriales bacterium]